MSLEQEFINFKYLKILEKQNDLREELDELQEFCEHPDVVKKNCGSTGNYDPSSDAYWIECMCPDCGKKRTLDGTH